jgi:hypothetical protein
MHEYEYIILGHDGRAVLSVTQAHLNDAVAIRSANSFARGREFEVWRDLDCIYGTPEIPRCSLSETH